MAGGPLNDHLTLDDKLGRVSLLHDVYRHVTSATPPCVIGIHGDWGSGKSSFLNQLEALLTKFTQSEGATIDAKKVSDETKTKLRPTGTEGPTYPVVWFEAWRYQHDPQPILTLLREIRRQLSPGQKILKWLTKESAVAIETALAGIDGVSKYIGFKVNPKEIREAGESYEVSQYQIPSFTVSVGEVLDRAVSQVVAVHHKHTKADRIIVIIDDLDRCSPETAQGILDGLKVFLNLQNVVFVLAMDETVVEEFIAQKYVDQDGASQEAAKAQCKRRARQYLEKLCQSIYRLPFSIRPEDLLLELLLERGTEPTQAKALWTMCAGIGAIPPNPRKIKLLAEVIYRFFRRVSPANTRVNETLALAYVLAYCFQFDSELYRLIETYKSEVFQEWLLPAVGLTQPLDSRLSNRLVLPRGLSPSPSEMFPDPVRSGVFYPAKLLSIIGSVSDADIEVLLQ